MIQRADLLKMRISGQIVFEILAQLSPGYALITPFKPFEIFWGSTQKIYRPSTHIMFQALRLSGED